MIVIIVLCVILSGIATSDALVMRSMRSMRSIASKTTSLTRVYDNNSSSSSSSSEKKAWQMVEAKTAREKASFSNKIPFSEDMYKVLKTSIELLSRRSTDKVPVSKEEAQWFADAIDVIIDDAKKYGPPPRPPKRTEP